MRSVLFGLLLVTNACATTGLHSLSLENDLTVSGGIETGTFELITPVYNDAQILLLAATKPSGPGGPDLGAFPAGQTTNAYLFDASSDECVNASLQLGHDYKEGTDLSCHLHWAPITTSTNTVVWELHYSIANTDGTIGNPTTAFVVDPGDGIANKHQMVDLASVDCSSCTVSAIMIVELCRDANGTNGTDNMAGDVVALSMDCHYQIDTLGSSAVNSK